MERKIKWPATAVPPALLNAAHRVAVDEALATEQATMRLLAVMPPRLASFVQSEVDRRMEFFEQVRMQTQRTAPVWPKRAAIESVYDDLVQGRL